MGAHCSTCTSKDQEQEINTVSSFLMIIQLRLPFFTDTISNNPLFFMFYSSK